LNFLAHLALADGSPDSICGAFLGDFVKGRPEGRFAPSVVRGIRLHRAIDRFTDSHPLVAQARARLPAAHRRYAGVALDLAFDHFLALRWQADAPADFDARRAHAYAVLSARTADLPPALQRVLPSLTGDDWLATYARFDGLRHAMERLSARLTRSNPLAHLADDIAAAYGPLQGDFDAFWPHIRRHACRENRRLARHQPA
jgi:acyl carrier protein phosphodiesterase